MQKLSGETKIDPVCQKDEKGRFVKGCIPFNKGTAKIRTCIICKKKFTYKDSRGKLLCSKKCTNKHSSNMKKGKLNPKFNNGWRQYINVKSDIVFCEKCNKRKKLEIHHKDGNRRNNKIDNLIRVCRRCHMLLDGRFKNLDYYNSGTGLCAKEVKNE